ncbi:MAG: DUF364 domain-containing protein [Peptococcaceae bacterium]|jgi:hypothetical protein|nr:DUF364 domain-containing protein [Peptococcaceae bacterium]MDH7524593.1 DUF364 domain-containing protein [Peptococcaceae bacterium]
MESTGLYQRLKTYLQEIIYSHHLGDEEVLIRGKELSAEEAIGKPGRQDYPLIKGKEKMLQAEFRGATGQAFTDSPGPFAGALPDFLNMPLDTNFQRAVFTAALNAVMRHLGMIEGTVHCKDEEPARCAGQLVDLLRREYGNPRVALAGFQPALLEHCSKAFPVRLVDLDKDNIGQKKCGIIVEDAELKTKELVEWCDLLLVTGSTIANGTISAFLQVDKPVIFYGTTIAGAAKILGLRRFCPCAK